MAPNRQPPPFPTNSVHIFFFTLQNISKSTHRQLEPVPYSHLHRAYAIIIALALRGPPTVPQTFHKTAYTANIHTKIVCKYMKLSFSYISVAPRHMCTLYFFFFMLSKQTINAYCRPYVQYFSTF